MGRCRKKKDDAELSISEKVTASQSTASLPKQESKAEKAKPEEVQTAQPKTTSKPVSAFKALSFNDGFRLKQAQQIVETTKTQAEEKTTLTNNQSFTLQQLREVVAEYTKKMQEQGKKQIANMLRTEVISLQNETEIII